MCKFGSPCSPTEQQDPLNEMADRIICALYVSGISMFPLTNEVAHMKWLNDMKSEDYPLCRPWPPFL